MLRKTLEATRAEGRLKRPLDENADRDPVTSINAFSKSPTAENHREPLCAAISPTAKKEQLLICWPPLDDSVFMRLALLNLGQTWVPLRDIGGAISHPSGFQPPRLPSTKIALRNDAFLEEVGGRALYCEHSLIRKHGTKARPRSA